VLDACEAAALSLGALGAGVEPMDDDMQPVEPIWFAYSSAMWNARFRDALPKWRDKISPTLLRQMELGKDITGGDVDLNDTQFNGRTGPEQARRPNRPSRVQRPTRLRTRPRGGCTGASPGLV
jgi:hypothetical protein